MQINARKKAKSIDLAAMGIALIFFACLSSSTALAQSASNVVRITYQYGLGFFPVTVVLDQHLIEKHALKQGLKDAQVTGLQVSGAVMSNDALLSGSADIVTAGIGGLLEL